MDTMDVLDAFEIEAITRELDGKIAEETKQIKEYNEYMEYLVNVLLEKEYSGELIKETLRNPNPVFKNEIGTESISEFELINQLNKIRAEYGNYILGPITVLCFVNLFIYFFTILGVNYVVFKATVILSCLIVVGNTAAQMCSFYKKTRDIYTNLEKINEQAGSDKETRKKLSLMNEQSFKLLLKSYDRRKKCCQNIDNMKQQKEFIMQQDSDVSTIDKDKCLKKQKNNNVTNKAR